MKYLKLYEEFRKLYKEIVKVKIPLPDDVKEFSNIFIENGYHLFLVGGSIRDFLLGNKPHDFDLVSDASPNEVKQILKNFNVSDEQGKNFGVVRVYTKDETKGYEIATFRKDISKGRDTKGSDKKVEIGKHITIEDDVKRRDLTQNALFYDIENEEIIDLVNGLKDIEDNKIVAVGDASKRFKEDRLRIMRVVRFACRNISEIDYKTSQAIKNDNRLTGISTKDDVSQERIFDEIINTIKWSEQHNKINSLIYYFELLKEYDMFKEIFPNMHINTNIKEITTFNIPIIFTILFKNINSLTIKKKLNDFKFPKNLISTIIFLLNFKNKITNLNEILILQKERKRINIKNSTIEEFSNIFNLNNKYVNAFLKFNPKINAVEIMKMGFKGTEIGIEKRKQEIEEFKNLLNL